MKLEKENSNDKYSFWIRRPICKVLRSGNRFYFAQSQSGGGKRLSKGCGGGGGLPAQTDDAGKIHFYFIGNLSEKNKKRLLALRKIQDFDYSFPNFDSSQFDLLPTNYHWNKSVYYRLLIPELIKDGGRAIYLDCDVIVDCDISKLWDMDLEGNFIGAWEVGGSEALQLERYFSSGVMIFDLEKLRHWDFPNKWRKYIQDNKDIVAAFTAPDQDLLNKVFDCHFYPFPVRYNLTTTNYYKDRQSAPKGDSILHYAPGKPLSPECPSYYRNLFFYYSQMTYWKINMFDFYLALFKLNPVFFLKPKWIRRLKNMRAEIKLEIEKEKQYQKAMEDKAR